MIAFKKYREKRFRDKLKYHLTEIFPEKIKTLSQEELDEIIECGVRKASAYQVTSEREVTLFIDLMFGLEPEFDQNDQYQWIVDILSRPDLNNAEKMDLIYKQL